MQTEAELAVEEKFGATRRLHPDGKKYKTDNGASEIKSSWKEGKLVVETKSMRGGRVAGDLGADPGRKPPDREREDGGRLRAGPPPQADLRSPGGREPEVRLTGLSLVAALLAPASFAGDSREAGTAALLEGQVRDGEPGLAALVRKDGKTVFARGYGRPRPSVAGSHRPGHGLPPRLGDQAVHGDGRHAARPRRQAPIRGLAHRPLPGVPGLREGDHGPPPADPHVRPPGLRGPDGGGREGPRAPLDAGATDPGRRGPRAAAGRDEGPLRAGDELGLQQLRLCRAGPRRRARLREAVRGLLARQDLRAPGDGPHPRVREGTPRGGSARIRPHARRRGLPGGRPEPHLGDPRRRGRLLQPRGPREMGRGTARRARSSPRGR